MIYPIEKIRSDFPLLSNKVNDNPFVYLDNAATVQKPYFVINSITKFYQKEYSSVHRGIYSLSVKATDRMENIRSKIAEFINASSSDEIIFVKNSTEGINLVSNSWGRNNLKNGDNIIITEMEHHSNIVPWQILEKEKNISLRYVPLLPNGKLDLSVLSKLIDKNTKLFSITQISNVLGTSNPILEIISQIRKLSDAVILVDGAQGVAHKKVDVQDLDCDFYVFSGHKLYGPSGIGILYVKKSILNNMPPWILGGSMIKTVSLTKGTSFDRIPWKFEAGSPNISGIIGLGAAIDYIKRYGIDIIQSYENKLMSYLVESLDKIPDITLYGPNDRSCIISFNMLDIHSHDVGIFLDQYGVAIRTGHQCAMPLIKYFRVPSVCRVSIAMYNNESDIDKLIYGLIRINRIMRKQKGKYYVSPKQG